MSTLRNKPDFAASDARTVNHNEKLVRMANQIASFFRAYPHEQAVAGIHDHIVAFWTPTMRSDLTEHISDGARGADPLVIEALHALTTGTSPARKETAGPIEVGEIGASDAG